MREIIFRGKRIDNGEWVYGCLVAWGTSMNYEIFDNGKIHQVKEDTVGQFTGLTDRNGVNIFEGDHLRDDYSDDEGNVIEGSVKVIWDNENAQWSIDNSFKQDGSSLTNLVYYLGINNLEVVSNG